MMFDLFFIFFWQSIVTKTGYKINNNLQANIDLMSFSEIEASRQDLTPRNQNFTQLHRKKITNPLLGNKLKVKKRKYEKETRIQKMRATSIP